MSGPIIFEGSFEGTRERKPFSIVIDGVNLDGWIDLDSLTEISQKVEGDSIWDYKLDSISLEFDLGALDLFNDVDEYTVQNLYRKLVEVKYYGNLIFGGIIGEVSYDFESEQVDLEIFSYGKVFADIELSGIFNNMFNVNGESLDSMYYMLVLRANTWLYNNQYPFRIENGYESNKARINLDDFEFYRQLIGDRYDLLRNWDLGSGDSDGGRWVVDKIFGMYEVLSNNFTYFQKGAAFLHVQMGKTEYDEGGLPTSKTSQAVLLLANGDIDWKSSKKITRITSVVNGERLYEIVVDVGDNSKVAKWIYSNFYNGNTHPIKGSYLIENTYWILIDNGTLFKLDLIQDDKFVWLYENPKVGDVQADFAVATNSLTWVTPKRELLYQSRTGIQTLNNPKKIISFEYEMIDQRGNVIELPDEIIFADSVYQDLVDFYGEYFNGIFNKYSLVLDKDQFAYYEYPLMLKELIVKVRGKVINVGIIKGIDYKEDTLEITTMRRL